MNRNSHAPSQTGGPSPTDAVRFRPAKLGHLIQGIAREQRLSHLPAWSPGPKSLADDRLVPEERVLKVVYVKLCKRPFMAEAD